MLYASSSDTVFSVKSINDPDIGSRSNSQMNKTNSNMTSGSIARGGSSESKNSSFKDGMSCLKSIEADLVIWIKGWMLWRRGSKQKVDRSDTESKKLWVALEDKNKKTLEEKIKSSDFFLGMLNDKVVSLEKERELLRKKVLY